MRCLSPRTVCFLADGKTISWSPKHYSKEYSPFVLPCGKCIECRLEYARQWAIRCVHESKMYDKNSFITLTYDNDNVQYRLVYEEFQLFMKRLRKEISESEIDEKYRIGYFVTGEYGEVTKRPHWHALIFNWEPSDKVYKYSNHRGDKVYHSQILDKLWTHGQTEVGSVTFESAGYVARYAAKKLVHGDDGHPYEPISKKSQRNAIGKKYLEKYYKDIFDYGYVVLDDGSKVGIPRYYEKWLQKNQPEYWSEYILRKLKKSLHAQQKEVNQKIKYIIDCEKRWERAGPSVPRITRKETETVISKKKIQELNKHLKGDL